MTKTNYFISPVKLGKRPAVRPYGLHMLTDYMTVRPPAPPATVQVPKVASWPMYGNDRLGDCTIAGAAHAMQAWNAEVNQNDALPTQGDVEETYFSFTGGADSGCVEATVLQVWKATGMFNGNRIIGYAPVATNSIPMLESSVAYYGACYVGIQCPESVQEQFIVGKPWTVVPGSPIDGGHCIVLVGYDAHAAYAVTWGSVVEVTWPFLAAYLDEAWAIIPEEFEQAGKGPMLDLKALQADIGALK